MSRQVEVACYGLSFVNGQADSTTQYYAAIFNDGGVLRLHDCLLLSNVVDSTTVLRSYGGNLTLSGCRVAENELVSHAILYQYGGVVQSEEGAVDISDTVFAYNLGNSLGVAGGHGSLSNATFDGNGPGALILGMYQDGSESSHTTLEAFDCAFMSNFGQRQGGALLSRGGSTSTFTRCTFRSNFATAGGGAIFVEDGSTITLRENAFIGNAALTGTAMLIFNSEAIIADCVIEGQVAETQQGYTLFLAASADVTLTGSSFLRNYKIAQVSDTVVRFSNITMVDNSCAACRDASRLGAEEVVAAQGW